MCDFCFNNKEGEQEDEGQTKSDQNLWCKPTHGGVLIGLYSIDHCDQERSQAKGEGEVPPPIYCGFRAPPIVPQADVAPNGAKEAKRNGNPKY